MTRALVPGAALLVLLAGCPLPQPLADYPKGTVTPPRILMDGIVHPESAVLVPAACPRTAPSYDLGAELVDTNTSESVTARWFVDYDRQNSARCAPAIPEEVIPSPGEGASNPTQRQVSPYHFVPYDHDPVLGGSDRAAAGVVHVVELVVSNSFDVSADDVALCAAGVADFPFRTPASSGGVSFETQVYKWVFVNVASAAVTCP